MESLTRLYSLRDRDLLGTVEGSGKVARGYWVGKEKEKVAMGCTRRGCSRRRHAALQHGANMQHTNVTNRQAFITMSSPCIPSLKSRTPKTPFQKGPNAPTVVDHARAVSQSTNRRALITGEVVAHAHGGGGMVLWVAGGPSSRRVGWRTR